jgi:hypothetical protein
MCQRRLSILILGELRNAYGFGRLPLHEEATRFPHLMAFAQLPDWPFSVQVNRYIDLNLPTTWGRPLSYQHASTKPRNENRRGRNMDRIGGRLTAHR